jgi:hypothetical protein
MHIQALSICTLGAAFAPLITSAAITVTASVTASSLAVSLLAMISSFL